jgi:ribosomal protein S8
MKRAARSKDGVSRFTLRQASGGTKMWTVIYIAPTAKMAENIKKRLTEEGFLVKIRSVNLSKQQYEILVPSGELEEVQEVFNSIIRP